LLSRFSRIVTFIALLQILGGHWAILQTAAWVGMVVSYTQSDSSLPEALKKTFDGDHPCVVCKMVKSGRASEEKKDLSYEVVKLDAVLADQIELPAPARENYYLVTLLRRIPGGAWPVPTPPPRTI
jgi:hypothetical protein